MWLATLLICSTQSVTSCNLAAQTETLLFTEAQCEEVVAEGMYIFTPTSYYVTGACVKLGEST